MSVYEITLILGVVSDWLISGFKSNFQLDFGTSINFTHDWIPGFQSRSVRE